MKQKIYMRLLLAFNLLLTLFITQNGIASDFQNETWFDSKVVINQQVWFVKKFTALGDAPYGASYINTKEEKVNIYFNGGHYSGTVSVYFHGVEQNYRIIYFPKAAQETIAIAASYGSAVVNGSPFLLYYNPKDVTVCFGTNPTQLNCITEGKIAL